METLDLGSGRAPRGTVNVDLNRAFRPTVVADVRFLPFKDSAFDGAYLSHILEHVIDPEKIVIELHRVMKSGRLATMILPNFASLNVLIAWMRGFYMGTSRQNSRMPYIIPDELVRAYSIIYGSHTIGQYDVHHVPLSLPIMRRLLVEAGFEVKSVKGDRVYLPFMRFKIFRKVERGLAKVFPSKADTLILVVMKT